MNQYQQSYFVCLVNGAPAGYIGVVNNDIRIAVMSEFQKMGVGRFMVSEILKRFPEARATVKYSNFSSQKLFESLGFTREFIQYRNPPKL